LGGGPCPAIEPPICPDAFYAQVSPLGETLEYATFLGGEGWDAALDLAYAEGGSAVLIGETYALDFPVTPGASDTTLSGGRDAFVARYEFLPRRLSYASYLGGSDWDEGLGVAAAPAGAAYLVGRTISLDFPTTPDAFSTSRAGDYDAFGVIQMLPPMRYVFLPSLRTASP
jgi:hypothetical protein